MGDQETKNVPKRKVRKLPNFPNFSKEDESLENLNAQNVFEQFLAKYPDQLGAILARCTPKVRSQAIKSLDSKDVVSAQIPISEMMTGKPLKLFDEITIIKMEGGETAHEVEYITLRASTLDERIFEVLSLWLEDFYKNHPDQHSRESYIELDGSARLEEDSCMSALQDHIETYVANLAIEKDTEEEDGEEDDEEDEEDKIENITELFRSFLSDVSESNGYGNRDKINLCRPTPKITIRYEAQ